ncbi:MAG: TRAP-type mannitol/chloroaromatic compound transport system substrate-binding protein [Alphaproteobacteria bacterium]
MLRSFSHLGGATLIGSAAATASVASPAVHNGNPKIHWRMTSSFPKSLDTLYGTAEYMAQEVFKMTDGNFKISVFAAGELAPALGALDVTSNGAVDACHTTSYYYVGKNEAFALATTIPFGLNARQQNAWLNFGGGNAALKPLFDNYNIIPVVTGNTGTQMGGWLKREIRTADDIKGLKMRIGGLAGQVFSALGGIPQQIPGTDIYPSLEKGVIDGAEWVGPYDDEKLGFHKVAPFYYYPGWWEGNAAIHSFFNKDSYAKLPAHYKAILHAACAKATEYMLARYDILNPPALRRIVASGTVLKKYSKDVLLKFNEASHDIYSTISAKNPLFADIFAKHEAFRKETSLWHRFAEAHFDHFMMNDAL